MNIITTLATKTKTGTPVSLTEAKAQLQIESGFTADDTHIQLLTAIALEKVEADTNSDVLETTNVLIFDTENGFQCYTIPQAPYLSVSKLEKQVDGQWSEVATTDYQITPAFASFDLELLASIQADKFRLTYKTGYAAANIPKVLKGAILIKTADLFDSERQGYTLNVAANRAYESLISKHIRVYY